MAALGRNWVPFYEEVSAGGEITTPPNLLEFLTEVMLGYILMFGLFFTLVRPTLEGVCTVPTLNMSFENF